MIYNHYVIIVAAIPSTSDRLIGQCILFPQSPLNFFVILMAIYFQDMRARTDDYVSVRASRICYPITTLLFLRLDDVGIEGNSYVFSTARRFAFQYEGEKPSDSTARRFRLQIPAQFSMQPYVSSAACCSVRVSTTHNDDDGTLQTEPSQSYKQTRQQLVQFRNSVLSILS